MTPEVWFPPSLLWATESPEALRPCAIILVVDPFPEEPVTTITLSGSLNFFKIFLSNFSAKVPGKELPLPNKVHKYATIFPKKTSLFSSIYWHLS